MVTPSQKFSFPTLTTRWDGGKVKNTKLDLPNNFCQVLSFLVVGDKFVYKNDLIPFGRLLHL